MMHWDDETGEHVACKVQAYQLPESLGEVDHCFCDKTGTLTLNDLDVRSISINGTVIEGYTREDIAMAMEKTCETSDTENLLRCFCLCNGMRVSKDPQSNITKYDGESQDELLLLLLTQAGSFFELVRRD